MAPAHAPLAVGAPRPIDRERVGLVAVVGLAAFVAASHLEAGIAMAPHSLALAIALGAVGLGTAGWAVRVARRPSAGALLAGAVGAAALAGMWLWTRAIGLPFGDAHRAPAGVLDAVTAADELLLAWFAVALATGRARRAPAGRARGRRAPRERWPVAGSVAISVSFIVLAMGCGPPEPAARSSAAGSAPALVCHLY